jgi:hypothetical protein
MESCAGGEAGVEPCALGVDGFGAAL